MTTEEKKEFKKLVKEGTLEALSSKDGQSILSKLVVQALKSEESKDFLVDFFVEALHDVLDETMENITSDLSEIKGDVADLRMDVNYLKESALKRDKFILEIKNKMIGRMS